MAAVDVLPAVPSKKFPIQATPALLISRNSVVPFLRDGERPKKLSLRVEGSRWKPDILQVTAPDGQPLSVTHPEFDSGTGDYAKRGIQSLVCDTYLVAVAAA